MGFTYTEERLCEEAVIQDFAHGALVACIEPNGVRYARLLVDGTWQMGVESRTRSRVPSNIAAIPSYLLELLEALACLAAAGGQDATNLASGAWEPKGLNIVDLVGSVPEEHLRKAMVVWSGEGAVQYVSGERDGDTVTVNALIFTKELEGVSYANCLGQWAHLDQWASAMPAGRVRLYAAGREITDQVGSIEYYPAAQARPDHGTERNRYNRTPQVLPTFNAAGALELAANTGCVIAIPGSYPELTAVFTLDHPSQTRLTHTGEEEFVFQTYVGVGEAGALDSLRNQLVERFGDRHDKFMLSPPNDTDYLFVNFPPTPVSAYGNGPLTNPSSGTYRLGEGDSILSTDHLISMGLPLLGQWRDADQSRSAPFLPQIGPIDTLTAPEYFVPPGIQYDPCMTEGDCPNDLLDAIYASKMAMTVYYYRITRIDETLQPFPLRLAGPGYDVAATDWSDWTPATDGICGWFDADGRMLDYSLGSTYDASGTEEAAKP